MTTRIIRKEFVVSKSQQTPYVLYPRSDGRWSGFMNTYAVWPTTGNEVNSYIIKRTFNAGYSGTYYFRISCDNSLTAYVDGRVVGSTTNFKSNPSPIGITLSAGLHQLQFNISNSGDVCGVAVTISDSNDSAILWDTRTFASVAAPTIGRYQLSMPFRANITIHAWGAGGGGGGMDAGTFGGLGSPGLYNTRTFQVNKGDLLEVFVGSGGNGAGSNSASAPGGAPGESRISLNGDTTKSFNGGSGTSAGPVPYSGGGGGGGGASGALVNNSPVLVAGGGGGGGGAGNDGNASDKFSRRDAAITKNAIGSAGSDYRGENGQSKGGDGGGAGGGGGGIPGGQGGPVAGGDASGFAGQCGGNFPVFSATTGTNTSFYRSGFSDGGARGGGNGQDGRVVLLIEPLALNSVKVSGDWKQIQEAFVKISGSWKEVGSIFVKVNDSWKEVNGSGQGDIELVENALLYGTSARGFS